MSSKELHLAARLVSTLAHELRTPLAIARTEIFNAAALAGSDPALARAAAQCERISSVLKKVVATVLPELDSNPGPASLDAVLADFVRRRASP